MGSPKNKPAFNITQVMIDAAEDQYMNADPNLSTRGIIELILPDAATPLMIKTGIEEYETSDPDICVRDLVHEILYSASNAEAWNV